MGVATHILWFRKLKLRLSDLSRVLTLEPILIGLVLFLMRYCFSETAEHALKAYAQTVKHAH